MMMIIMIIILIIKELVEQFKGILQCLDENTEKYLAFSLPIPKRKGQDSDLQIKLIDCLVFIASSLSILVDNLAEVLHKGKCENFNSCLEYALVKDNTLAFKFLDCNKYYEKEIEQGLTKRL